MQSTILLKLFWYYSIQKEVKIVCCGTYEIRNLSIEVHGSQDKA